jgi:hypothetical protein
MSGLEQRTGRGAKITISVSLFAATLFALVVLTGALTQRSYIASAPMPSLTTGSLLAPDQPQGTATAGELPVTTARRADAACRGDLRQIARRIYGAPVPSSALLREASYLLSATLADIASASDYPPTLEWDRAIEAGRDAARVWGSVQGGAGPGEWSQARATGWAQYVFMTDRLAALGAASCSGAPTILPDRPRG